MPETAQDGIAVAPGLPRLKEHKGPGVKKPKSHVSPSGLLECRSSCCRSPKGIDKAMTL